MKIRRVDDKRMVIHTKARAKVHIKCRQGMKIKQAGSYAVQGISDVNSKKTDNKTVSYRISDNKKLLQGKKPAVLAEVPEKNVQHITGGIQSRQAAVLAVPHGTQDKTDYKKDVRKCINRENEMYARHQKNRTGKGCIKKTAVLKIAKKTASNSSYQLEAERRRICIKKYDNGSYDGCMIYDNLRTETGR